MRRHIWPVDRLEQEEREKLDGTWDDWPLDTSCCPKKGSSVRGIRPQMAGHWKATGQIFGNFM